MIESPSMLKHSKKSLLLAAALLVPATAFAQENKDAPAKESEVAVQEVAVENVEEVEVEVADEKEKKQHVKVVIDSKSSESAVIEIDDDGNHVIRMIEIDGDDVPQHLHLILKQLNTLKGTEKSKDGRPKVMSFRIGADGALKGDATHIDKHLKEAMKSIDVSFEGVDGQVEEHVIRVLQNVKPGVAQLKMLKGQSVELKNLTDVLANVKGTISISTSASSSSTSKDGEKPKVVTNSQIRILGPDGKVQEMTFDANALNQESVSKAVEAALKKSGKQLPEEIQKRVQDAMKRAEARSRAIWVQDVPVGERVKSRKPTDSSRGIEKKLDLILERLEKMQQEIDALKK